MTHRAVVTLIIESDHYSNKGEPMGEPPDSPLDEWEWEDVITSNRCFNAIDRVKVVGWSTNPESVERALEIIREKGR